MAIYPTPPAHERLNVFFGEFFREMRKAPLEAYGNFLMHAEKFFKQAGYRETTSGGINNILIVRLDAIGDMILTSGFIREVRANFPRAHITLVVSPRVYPIVELCPYVNEVLSFDKGASDENFVDLLERISVFCREHFWHKKISVAFSPHFGGGNFPVLLMLWLSGARERIGNRTFSVDMGFNRFLLTKVTDPPENIISQPEKFFHVLTAADFKVNQNHMELWYSAEDFQRASELLEDIPPDCKKISVGIGAGAVNRKYPVEKYLVALKTLAEKNFCFVILGGKTELDDAAFLEKNLPREKVLNLAGKTTLRESEAVISQMDFYIGNCSGVKHMAAAAQVPVLEINREPQDRENIAPSGLSEFLNFPPWQTKAVRLRPKHPLGDCATLPPIWGHCHHKEPHCITQITPQEIIAGFERLYRETI